LDNIPVDTEWVLRILLFSAVHWVLAWFTINDLACRPRVFGGHKAPWVFIILFIPSFGSLAYLLFHPEVLDPGIQRKKQDRNRSNKGQGA
jgi:hypothetical protein